MSKPIYINARFLTQKITGVQRFGMEISKQLQNFCDCVFISPPNILYDDLSKELNVQIIGRSSSHIWEQFELPIYLKQMGSPLLFNYNGLGPIFYPNKIITIHDLSFMENPQWFSWQYSMFYKFFTSVSANYSKKIVTVSKFSKDEIIRKLNLSSSKIDIIYNAVSMNETDDTNNLIGSPYILTVSSLDPRKNLNRLIEAFNKLGLSDYKLVVVGSSNKIFNKSNKSIANENIIFWGHADNKELISLYKHADLFVFPSLYEGFGIPPLEAMSVGCPVISSNATSLKEVCGDAAVFIDPYDINSISTAIQKLINDKEIRSRLIEAGYKNVARFSWRKSAEKLALTFKELNS